LIQILVVSTMSKQAYGLKVTSEKEFKAPFYIPFMTFDEGYCLEHILNVYIC